MFEYRLHAYLRALAGPRAHRAGPFLASFDDGDNGLFRNYAIPDDRADPTPAQVTELIEAFLGRSRIPRLEYLPGLCPAVEPALLAAGFVLERRLPVMSCLPTHATARPLATEIELTLATTDEQLSQVADAQNEAYGQPETTDHDVARLRGTVDNGGIVALARDTTTGCVVGGGLLPPPHDGISELAAIGVRAPYRRRGIAAALTALLTRSCPTVGITTPFLTPAGEAEERIYHSAGYRRVTEMIHISVPPSRTTGYGAAHGSATTQATRAQPAGETTRPGLR